MIEAKQSILLAVLFLVAVCAPLAANALQESRPIATDYRLQNIRYSPNEVFKFTGHYGYQSSIEFSPDETIQTVSIGDSIAWMINPVGNRLFLKPIEQDALTNMTVITDKRIYHFELHARETENIRDRGMIFVMRFSYPEEDLAAINYAPEEELPDFRNEPERFNFRYSIRGSETIAPIRIFDDGEFTYFEFPGDNTEVPAFFHVDAAGEESVINFRARGDFIVVERVSPVFTLRRGPYIACVYNETLSYEATPPPVQRGIIDRIMN